MKRFEVRSKGRGLHNPCLSSIIPRKLYKLMNTVDKTKASLSRLESRLQTLVEGSLARLFLGLPHENSLAQQLVAALYAGCKTLEDGRVVAPNFFTLAACSSRASLLREQADWLAEVTRALESEAQQAGFLFLDPVIVSVCEDESLPEHRIQVSAQIHLDQLARTSDVEAEAETASPDMPLSAFLIINGVRVFPLDRPVVNIGRRPDNHLVIDDPRVSRLHAQLRLVKGRFVIFDLDSTAGTTVNGKRISQSVLFPGDVVSIAGVPLVYGQDQSGLGQTQKYELPDPAQPHAEAL
jgi:hypothetical protein